jgi:phospholipid/cholesterol/gamma-HCH transport system substrate-binding protein
MRLSSRGFRTATLAAFVVACLVFTGYLYGQAGGRLPGFRTSTYTVSFEVPQVNNLVTYADVLEAGVLVGKVSSLTRDTADSVRITLRLDSVAAPLHRGATVQLSEKSLAGQPAVRLVDGTGPELPDGTLLSPADVLAPVTLRDVLASLDKPTLDALGGSIRSLGQGLDGRGPDVAAMTAGLSDIGNNGDTALDAVAAQSEDLSAISQQLNQVFDAMDTGQGQIVHLVSTANRLAMATAGQRPAVEDAMRQLPGVLASADAASVGVSRLAHGFSPVAADLRQAAPDLNESLDRLPGVTSDLRRLLPTLHSVLDHAPDTLHRVPRFGSRARDVFPAGVDVLRDLNPMLRYLKPYGADITQIFTAFGAAFHHYSDDGASYIYLRPYFTGGSLRPDPVNYPGFVQPSNPYPAPGGLRDLKPFRGKYERIERDGH